MTSSWGEARSTDSVVERAATSVRGNNLLVAGPSASHSWLPPPASPGLLLRPFRRPQTVAARSGLQDWAGGPGFPSLASRPTIAPLWMTFW